MKQRIRVLTVFCLMILLYPWVMAQTENPQVNSISQTTTTTEISDDATGGNPISRIIKRKKLVKQTRRAEVRRYRHSENEWNMEIIWVEGEKQLLSFPGRQYKLDIDCDSKSAIIMATFTFKDNSDSSQSIACKRVFKPPLDQPLESELKKLLDLALAALNSESIDAKIIDNFDLRPFYEKFVKKPTLEQINK